MAVEEACLPWNPLPARFSTSWQVDVVQLVEGYRDNSHPGENLSIAIAAYSEPTETEPREDAAWRIDFRGCIAYRMRTTHYRGSAPLTYPDPANHAAAFWEITPSRYAFGESGGLAASSGAELHHFVILAAIHTVYEILAQGWRCTPLPSVWAKPFSSGPFPQL